MNYAVYIFRCADNTLYCGITTDLKYRLYQHNNGSGAKYTRGRAPVTFEIATDYIFIKSEALKLEAIVKRLPRHKKIDFLREIHLSVSQMNSYRTKEDGK